MMGISLDGPGYMYFDNNSVVCNTTMPESTPKKKSNSIAYHCVREAVAMGKIIITYEPTETNISDLMTKALPGGARRMTLVRRILYDDVGNPAIPRLRTPTFRKEGRFHLWPSH
jgi:hypothetical protein